MKNKGITDEAKQQQQQQQQQNQQENQGKKKDWREEESSSTTKTKLKKSTSEASAAVTLKTSSNLSSSSSSQNSYKDVKNNHHNNKKSKKQKKKSNSHKKEDSCSSAKNVKFKENNELYLKARVPTNVLGNISSTTKKHKASSMENNNEDNLATSTTRPSSKKARTSRNNTTNNADNNAQGMAGRQKQQEERQEKKGGKKELSQEEDEESTKTKQQRYHNHQHHHHHEQQQNRSQEDKSSSLLTNLLDRLRNCYSHDADTSNLPSFDETRARNLLEAAGGNLDLAVMLHWEDLAVSHCSSNNEDNVDHHSNNNHARSDNSNNNAASSSSANNNRRAVRFSQQQPRHGSDRQEEGDTEQQQEVEQASAGGREVGEQEGNADEVAGNNENAPPNEEEHLVEERAVDSNSVSISDDEGATSSNSNNNNASSASSRFMFHLFDEEIGELELRSSSSNSSNQRNRLSTSVADSVNATTNGEEDNPFEYDTDTEMHNSPSSILWGSSTIPQTWLQCGFTLSTLGLIASNDKPPNTTSTSSRNNRHKNKIIHCPGVTALLSLVTALLQSNACIQGRSVLCTISRKRFSDLKNDDERRRLFHNRLADALSAILHVAAKSKANDLARLKQKIHEDNNKSSGIDATSAVVISDSNATGETARGDLKSQRQNKQRRQFLQHLFKLQSSICPVCTWKKEPSNDNNNNAENNRPSSRSSSSSIGESVFTSKTNINDLRAFIFSHIRAFTSKGGISLFLENICRIHGTKRIKTMLKKAGSDISSLINCSCTNDSATSSNNDKNKTQQSNTQSCCLSIEFLSLILSGTIHTSLKGWNANSFGIGLLSSSTIISPKNHTIDPGLLNPKKYIWIILGDQYCSTIWLKEQNKDIKKCNHNSLTTIADNTRALDSKTAFYLTHWDCNKGVETTMRIFPNDTKSNNNVITSSLSLPTDEKTNKVSLDNVTCHADDAKYYKEYVRWRFSFSNDIGDSSIAQVFKPYFQLSATEKYLVDLKYCHKIQLVLWSRWNGAIIDDFSNGCPPAV